MLQSLIYPRSPHDPLFSYPGDLPAWIGLDDMLHKPNSWFLGVIAGDKAARTPYEDASILLGHAVELLNEEDLDVDIAQNVANALRRELEAAPTPLQAAMGYFAEELEFAVCDQTSTIMTPEEFVQEQLDSLAFQEMFRNRPRPAPGSQHAALQAVVARLQAQGLLEKN